MKGEGEACCVIPTGEVEDGVEGGREGLCVMLKDGLLGDRPIVFH